jgi:uncharacterized repeat protein (TIGR04076 family)
MNVYDKIRRTLKSSVGITDDDFDIFVKNLQSVKLVSFDDTFRQYRFEAEVIESKYCTANIKEGQRYIILGLPTCVVPEESDCPLCIKAIAPMVEIVDSYWQEIIEGQDPCGKPPKIADCLDPGINGGGLGHVKFKITAKRLSAE